MPTLLPRVYQKMRRLYESAEKDRRASGHHVGAENDFVREFGDALQAGEITGDDYSIKALFEHLVEDGRELVEYFHPSLSQRAVLHEAGDAVDTSAFSNISGQIVYTTVMQGYESPTFLHRQLVNDTPTDKNGEKIAGITDLGDVFEEIKEGEKYPVAGVSEEWIETPTTKKRGIIIPVTKEAIFFDRTGDILRRAGAVGEAFGINKEKRVLDLVTGITTTYKRNGGAAQATYANSHTNGDFDNLATSNPLVDWESFEAMELLWDEMGDPNHGEPVMINLDALQLLIPTALKHTAKHIVNATALERETNNTAGTANQNRISPNTIQSYPILSNQYVKARTSSASTWFLGEFKKAFTYMQNWPLQVLQAPQNAEAEFERDIVVQFKGTERGAATVLDPRYAGKATA